MENNNVVSTTETVEEVKDIQVEAEQLATKKEVKTYTRDEINKIISAEKAKLREELEKENELKRTEAEKLAKMDAEEKANYKLEQANKKAQEIEAKLNAYELKEEATKIAREKGVPQSLLNIIDYTKENADSIKSKIEEIEVTYKQALQEGINDRMKEKTPKTVVEETTTTNKPRASF